MENVRCFEGEQRATLRPITLLLGENSTGKTSFLGCFRVVSELYPNQAHWDYLGVGTSRVDFNQEPFLMGSFRDIVRSRRGREGRINEFKLGLVACPPQRTGLAPYPIRFTFSERGSEPVVSSYRMQFTEELYLEVGRETDSSVRVRIPGYDSELDLPFVLPAEFIFHLFFSSHEVRRRNGKTQDLGPVFRFFEHLMESGHTSGKDSSLDLDDFIGDVVPWTDDLISIAPLRSKPKRTYDPVRESASPEGEHIPMLLMRLDRTEKRRWDSLHDHLVDFGSKSGLFSDLKVKRHGRQMSDPFQLQVKVRSGSHANIMDVGYGVSQSLPILVDLMSASKQTFLLQQPEVHLHPRGQAELASLFVQSWKAQKNQFLIETHSDHVIDRVRISVRRGDLKPEDVSILYFEPKRNSVQIHNLSLDKQGNLLDAPPGYRDFFLRETDRLLGFRDD
ncbi:MAG: AAA family ATPase [Gammaproteobacteria bacterium]|nr:AAA family ATPase [Gammaproteobacteria bacterium]